MEVKATRRIRFTRALVRGALELILVVLGVSGATGGELRGHMGLSSFVDDAFLDHRHFSTGVAVRWALNEQFALEPEFLYLAGGRHQQNYAGALNLAREFGRPGRLRLELLGGIGVLHHRQRPRSEEHLYFQGGAGIKVFLSPHWYFEPQFRVGGEKLFVLFSSVVGYRWGR